MFFCNESPKYNVTEKSQIIEFIRLLPMQWVVLYYFDMSKTIQIAGKSDPQSFRIMPFSSLGKLYGNFSKPLLAAWRGVE
jgi:hypothetical protein